MIDAMFALGVVACLGVAAVLMYGLRGWGTGKLTSAGQNKVMRLRIAAQFAAVIILMALYFLMEKP